MLSKLDDQIQKPFQYVADKLWAWKDISCYLLASNSCIIACIAFACCAILCVPHVVIEHSVLYGILIPLNAYCVFTWWLNAKRYHAMHGRDPSKFTIDEAVTILVALKMRMLSFCLFAILTCFQMFSGDAYSLCCVLINLGLVCASRFATCLPRPPAKRTQRESASNMLPHFG